MNRPTEIIEALRTGTLHGPIPTASTMKLLEYILHLESRINPGHRLTEDELDAAVSTYEDSRAKVFGANGSKRAALEIVIRNHLKSINDGR